MVGEQINNSTSEQDPKKQHSLEELEGRIERNKSQLLTLSQLLCGKTVFIVPDYQRGYAWNKEARDLWYDIMRIYDIEDGSKKHYTGLLVLNQIDPLNKSKEGINAEDDAFYVVDGQQRLTTLFIFLNFVLRELKETNSSYIQIESDEQLKRFMYSKNRNDNAQDFFKEYVYGIGKHNPDDIYKKNIKETCEFIDKELFQFDENGLRKLKDIILNKIVFNVFCDFLDSPEDDRLDVRMTFETMNNRGKQLSVLELLKNRMMYLVYNFAKPNKQADYAKQIDADWNEIYKNLSLINVTGDAQKLYYAKDETFVMAHWYVCFGTSKANSYVYAEQIFNTFSLGKMLSGEIIIDNLLAYCDSLAKYSAYWAIVNYPEDNIQLAYNCDVKDKEIEYLSELNCLNVNLYIRALLMVVLVKDPEDSNKKDAFFTDLIDFIFLNMHILNVKNDLSPFITIVKDYIKIDDHRKLNDFYDKLNSRINDKGKDTDHFDFSFGNWKDNKKDFYEKLEDNFIDEHIKHGFYTNSWNGIQYFLYKYDQVKCPEKFGNPLTYDKLSKTSIEHIFPQTSDNNDYWNAVFNMSYPNLKDHYDIKEQKELLKNMLGNLVLVTGTDENASLSNRCYPIKSGHYTDERYNCNGEKDIKATYIRSTRSAYELSEKYKFCWLPINIENRTIELMDFLYEQWLKEYISKPEWDDLYKDKLKSKIELSNKQFVDISNKKKKIVELDQKASEEIKKLPSKKDSSENEIKKISYGDELLKRFNLGEFRIYKNKAVHTKPGKGLLNVEGTYVVVDKINNGNGLIHVFTKDKKLKVNDGNIEFGYNTKDDYVFIQSNKYHDKPSPLTEDDYNNLNTKIRRFIYVFVEFIRNKFDKPQIDIKIGAGDDSLTNFSLDRVVEAVYIGLKKLRDAGSNDDIKEEVINYLNISEDEKNVMHVFKSGNNNMTQLDYMLTWARTYLRKYGVIENTSHAHWKISEKYSSIENINGEEVVQYVRKHQK